MSELKACPFCGSEARLSTESGRRDNPRTYTGCEGAGCRVSICRQTESEAIEAWNTRAEPEPSSEALVAALVKFAGIVGCENGNWQGRRSREAISDACETLSRAWNTDGTYCDRCHMDDCGCKYRRTLTADAGDAPAKRGRSEG